MLKIKEIRKLKRLYSLTFAADSDSDFGKTFDETHERVYITEDTVVKFILSKGKLLTLEEVKEIVAYANYSRGKNLAIYYISFKMRTRYEVYKYLVEHEIPIKDIPKILDELEKISLIDDRKYVENYISGKVTMGANGPFQIKQKLQQKGLGLDLIDEALGQLYAGDEQLNNAISQAEKVVRAKAEKLPLKQLKLKISQALTRKGFSYDIVSQAIEALDLEADEENEQDLLAREAEKAYQRLSRRYEGYELKNKLTQSLARKGFDWSTIDDGLRDYDF